MKADRSANIPVLSGSTMKLKPQKDIALPIKTDPSRKGKSALPTPKIVLRVSSFKEFCHSASLVQPVEGRAKSSAGIDN